MQQKLLDISIKIDCTFLQSSVKNLDSIYIPVLKKLFLEIDSSLNLEENTENWFKNLIYVKQKFIDYILNKYEINKFNIDIFDQSLYNIINIVSEPDLLLGRKIIMLESIYNLVTQQEFIVKICFELNNLKDRIPQILSLPEVITHNDVHPLNFLISLEEKYKMYIIDFDRAGKNKRICDIGYMLTTNNPNDDVIASALRGYRKNGNNLTHLELSLVYDLYSLIHITSFAHEVCDLNPKNYAIIKYVFNPKKYYDKIAKFVKLSKQNHLTDILDKIIIEDLEALDLAVDKKLENKQKISLEKSSSNKFMPGNYREAMF